MRCTSDSGAEAPALTATWRTPLSQERLIAVSSSIRWPGSPWRITPEASVAGRTCQMQVT